MDLNLIKEQFNAAFVRAISAQAGFSCEVNHPDQHSEDIVVLGEGFCDSGVENPRIAFQLKATSRKIVKNSKIIKFRLKKKNYNDLVKTNIMNPRYLAVMLLPDLREQWLEHGFMSSTIRRECFWVSLKGREKLVDKDSITIEIPITNKLNASVIKSLLADASKRIVK